MIRLLLTAILAATVALTPAQARSQTKAPEPGGIAVVNLGAAGERPRAKFGRRDILVVADGPVWLGVVGLPRDLVPGEYIVTMAVSDDPVANVSFRVRTGESKLQNIQKPEDGLPPESELATWPTTKEFSPTPPFSAPALGNQFSDYGVTSRAIELESADGGSIVAPATGRVTDVVPDGPGAHRVTIDHGAGVYSIIAPIYNVSVATGDRVLQSVRLGQAGAMAGGGRSGIRWALSLNGVLVNPKKFTSSIKRP